MSSGTTYVKQTATLFVAMSCIALAAIGGAVSAIGILEPLRDRHKGASA